MICEYCGEPVEDEGIGCYPILLSKKGEVFRSTWADGCEAKVICLRCADELGLARMLGVYEQSTL